jgi:predicted metal-dependent phosphoesterase TrpH
MAMRTDHNLFKADLHVHTHHSGRAKHMRLIKARDCYSKPQDVYRVAKQRGMNLVTITDHDSIAGCLELLDARPDLEDFIIGEEVTAYLPAFQHSLHIGVYGINEAIHREIQCLRGNADELVAYLRQNDLLFSLNHLFHNFTRLDQLLDFLSHVMELFGTFEVRNGAMQREHNEFILRLVKFFERHPRQFSMIGGSDSHTLRRIGTTYTASYARTKEEFLADIRNGRTMVRGRHADHRAIAADIYGVVLRYYPNVLRNRLREFGGLERLKNTAIVFACSPFLFLPYLIALRHTHQERRRIRYLAQLFDRLAPTLVSSPTL